MDRKIFDVHAHIYPDSIAPKATNAIVDFYNEFDVEAHGKGSLEDCIAEMNRAGTTMFAAHSVAVRPHNARRISEFILEARDSYPDRIVPFAAIHPDQTDFDEYIEWVREKGFKGFKIHPDMQKFQLDGRDAEPMLRAIESSELPVLIHCGDSRYDFDGPSRVLSLHKKMPGLKMIAAHFGGWLQWEEAVKILPDHGITVDLSSSLYKWSTEQAAEVIRSFGAKNVLYGTDYPMWNPGEELKRFLEVPLMEAEQEDILWNNAAKLFKLDNNNI